MAQGLEITGWVRNRRDGTVEMLACGDDADLQTFQEWLHKGPRYAIVTEVDCTAQPRQDFPEFQIKA